MKRANVLHVLMITMVAVACSYARSRPFIFGADISWVDQREDSGEKYYDEGSEKDIFGILAEHKFNWIRLRVFVDPTARVPETSESPYSSQGYCDLPHTIEFAKRIKAAGMKFLLDFHYSDVWCDPGKQYKPMSWRDLSYEELVEKVRSYTRESLEACEEAGVLPDMVQVGNEVVGGMIWPDGRSSNMSQFAELLNAGIDGVKDVSEDIEIMIHSVSENSPTWWLTNLKDAGVNRIDIFGLSYYSEWHGTTAELEERLDAIMHNHDERIVIAEYADNHKAVNDIIYNLPDERGVGTFVWEPTQWMEALFDWGSGGRSTNSKIDLYPELSREYGNDDIVAVEHEGDGNISRQSGNFHVDKNGILRLPCTFPKGASYELFTLEGRLVTSGSFTSSSSMQLPVSFRSGSYLFKTSGNQFGTHMILIGNVQQ